MKYYITVKIFPNEGLLKPNGFTMNIDSDKAPNYLLDKLKKKVQELRKR